MVGGHVGEYLGGWIGSIPNQFIAIARPLGSFIGSFTGSYTGRVIVKTWGYDYYEMEFGAIDMKFGEAVYEHYKVPLTSGVLLN